MTRKEWLKAFLKCVDTGASTLDFRRYCRVKAQHLPRHMKQVDAYRDELARLESEKPEVAEATLVALGGTIENEEPDESRGDEEENTSGQNRGDTEEDEEETQVFRWPGQTFGGNQEALGTREDSGDEPDLHD